MKLNRWKAKVWKFNGWSVCGIALVAFAAGSLTTARWMHVNRVSAASDRVFELRVYHAVPDKDAGTGVSFSRHMVQAARQTRSEGRRLLGARGRARLGQHIHLPRGSFQPGGSEKELGCDAGRPRHSRDDQIRAGQQAGGEN